jgi:uncharacterized protein with HEPN domain
VRSDRERLLDILDAIESVRRTITGGRASLDDEVMATAAVRWLEVIGEAASRLSPELRARHPDVAWQGPIDMRNRLIHGYFDLNVDRIWEAIDRDVPTLERQIRAILEDLGES